MAVERERVRLGGEQIRSAGAKPRSGVGQRIQASLGAPTALIDTISEQLGTRIIEETEIDGPEN